MRYDITIAGKNHHLRLERNQHGWQCLLDDGRDLSIDAVRTGRDSISVLLEGKSYEIRREHTSIDTYVWVGNQGYAVEVRDPRSLRARSRKGGDETGPRKLIASMPGKVVRLLVTEKAEVEVGQGIVVVEAMKMQNEIKSPKKGIVQKLIAAEGANVNAGDVLAIVE